MMDNGKRAELGRFGIEQIAARMGGKGKKKKGAKDSSGTGGGAAGGGGSGTPAKEKPEAEEGDEEDGEAKPKKGKGKKGKGKGGKSSKFQGDIFNEAAMENAYYICHNIQDVLKSRGFAWPEGQKKKKKGKK
uniref:Small lysine-rich protein 1 n=1 Tax=Anopheles farauti TaxID=69004 RepID=A0A182QI81_9DIPT